jgi:2-polyprenyl-3-methyl-5-hydroxy-6-metoxy-1,4-benzoquinol methylase
VQELVSALVRHKTVLDVGCVDHDPDRENTSAWLHKHIVRNAASVLGIDIQQNGIAQLQERGYRVVCADAASVALGDRFDVIVAGEILEHLDNPGQFLSNMRRHLAPGGMLILTTPNVFYVLHFIESIFCSPPKRWNYEHVCWYCSFTLNNLLTRARMRIRDCVYVARSRKIRSAFGWCRLKPPKMLASTIVVVAEAAE